MASCIHRKIIHRIVYWNISIRFNKTRNWHKTIKSNILGLNTDITFKFTIHEIQVFLVRVLIFIQKSFTCLKAKYFHIFLLNYNFEKLNKKKKVILLASKGHFWPFFVIVGHGRFSKNRWNRAIFWKIWSVRLNDVICFLFFEN